MRNVAKAKRMAVHDVTVMILDRDRHQDVVSRVRKMGARVRLITDGDVAGAIMAAKAGTGVDLLYGIGGTPEGVVAAAALKCLGGEIQGRLYPRDDNERRAAIEAGYDLEPHPDDRRPGQGRGRVLRGDRHHRRRAGPGRAVRGGDRHQ